jgi:hypothetical protein
MMLITKDGRTVATGHKVINNLYKMQVTVRIVKGNAPIGMQTFAATGPLESWETWHKRFGHVGYSGLKRLWEKNLVDNFTVDTHTPTPDCVACTEAKLRSPIISELKGRQHQVNFFFFFESISVHLGADYPM